MGLIFCHCSGVMRSTLLRLISRSSQARAEDQLRLTVAVEIPRNSDVSSIESPPKYLSSIIWLCWESSLASLLRASSSANRSTAFSCRRPGEAMLSSRVNRVAPDPRLEARRLPLVIHQDPAHQLSGDADKMGAIFDLQRLVLGKSQIYFVRRARRSAECDSGVVSVRW